jgi:DNA-binding transcriptional ArsR family regulator
MIVSRPERIERIAEYFRILREPMRLRILDSLREGEKTVSELVRDVDASQPNVSKHLDALTRAGIVGRRRDKNRCYCSIADRRVFEICEIVCRET